MSYGPQANRHGLITTNHRPRRTDRFNLIRLYAACQTSRPPGFAYVRTPQTDFDAPESNLKSDFEVTFRSSQSRLRAFGGRNEYEVAIASKKLDPRRLSRMGNVKLVSAQTTAEVRSLYEWADLVVVPLKTNHHASGITVLFEGIISGVPVIVTDTGGLRAYFSDNEAGYVPPNAPDEMRAMADALSSDCERRLTMVARAQDRMRTARLTKQGYAERHRELTERVLATPRGSRNRQIEPAADLLEVVTELEPRPQHATSTSSCCSDMVSASTAGVIATSAD
jgi:hypothetical protein